MPSVGKKITTRYILEGRHVPKTTPGAEKVRTESEDFYGFWRDERGKQHAVRFKHCRDRRVAQQLLARLMKEQAEERAGLRPQQAASKPIPPLPLLVEQYLSDMVQRGLAERYISEQERLLLRACAEIPLKEVADIQQPAIYRWASSLLNKRIRAESGSDPLPLASARTRETHRSAVAFFTSWLVSSEVGILDRDPLFGMKAIKGTPVKVRRWLRPDELQKLLDAARLRPLHNWQTLRREGKPGVPVQTADAAFLDRLRRAGQQRALIYKYAALTLSRYGAIRSLTVAALHLDDECPIARHSPKDVKGRRDIAKPLPPALVADLRAWVTSEGKRPGDLLFDMPTQIKRELRKDLSFAGIPYKDELGRTFDFHCFKMCGITALAVAKVDVRLAQLYAEHKDIRLTLQTYNDIQGRPMDELFKALPDVH